MSAIQWLEPAEFAPWRKRLDVERRAGNLTATRQLALRAVLAFVGADGLFPSDAAVAALAGCSSRTVRRARHDARALGLLAWERTRKLDGGRWRQGPNVYRVNVPTTPVCSGGQSGRQVEQKRKKEAYKPPVAPMVAQRRDLPVLASDLLTARRIAYARIQATQHQATRLM